MKNIKKPFDGTYNPITIRMGLIQHQDFDLVVKAFLDWKDSIHQAYRNEWTIFTRCKSLIETFDTLLPLTIPSIERVTFIPTKSDWVAYFDNSLLGTQSGWADQVAMRLNSKFISRAYIAHTRKEGKGDYGYVGLKVVGINSNGERILRRLLELTYETKWDFVNRGTPFEFENTEQYKVRRKRDKFTGEILDSYLKELGIDAFDEDFYFPDGTQSVILQNVTVQNRVGQKRYSLEEARTRFE